MTGIFFCSPASTSTLILNLTMKVFIKNLDSYIDFRGGETLAEILERPEVSLDFTPVCARVNNKTESLMFPLFAPKQVEFVGLEAPDGYRTYIRSLCMMLFKAVTEKAPGLSLRIEHAISRGYYCRLFERETGKPLACPPALVETLEAFMKELVGRDLRFVRKERLTEDALKLFRAEGLDDKVLLLETTGNLYTTYYTLDDLADSYYGPLVPRTSRCPVFALVPSHEGFLLMGPDKKDPVRPTVPEPQEKMFRAFTDYQEFNRVVKVSTIGQLNEAVEQKRTAELINVAEAMHDKYLGRISDRISARHDDGGARVVLLAGPSSSGKTTTTKRLAIQLMTNLKVPKMISLDDYFVDRSITPRDETGDYDYESLYALDLERFNSDLNRLLAGETINLPTYSFETGHRLERERPLRLEKDDILLIEGIHGLNPELTGSVSPDQIFKVYVSALTTLGIDEHNWISPNDNRLLRRIVRDYKYRHTSALDTLRRWPSVRRGEEKWIFPFQENADATFNSSLIFELGVMKNFAEPILQDVPHNVEQYREAHRLLRFLGYFKSIPADQIPSTSLLREFLGGSSFHY